MTWTKGTLEYFNGGHSRDIVSPFTGTAGTNYWAIETATVRSGQTALKCTKTSTSNSGVSYINLQTGRSFLCTTIVLQIVSHAITSGQAMGIASFTPTSGNFTPDLAIYNDAGALKLRLQLGTTELWRGTQTLSTGIWYIIQFLNYNPKAGVNNDQYRGMAVLRNSSAVELERSPIVNGSGAGTTLELTGFGMGAWRGQFSATTDEIVYIVDTFAVVGGGAMSPIDVKTAPLYPDTDGPTNNQWIHDTATSAKFNGVDDPASVAADGNTTYVITNNLGATSDSATTGPPGTMTDTGAFTGKNYTGATVTSGGKTMVIASNTADVLTGTAGWSGGGNPGAATYTFTTTRQSFTDSGGSGITLTGSETVFAVMNWVAYKITGAGLVNNLLLDSGTEASTGGVIPGSTTTDTYAWFGTGPYPRKLAGGVSRLGGSTVSGTDHGWDVTAVNALEFGAIRGSGSSNNRRMTACYVEILYGLTADDVDITGGHVVREHSEQEPTTTTNPDLDITSIAVAGNVITTERAHQLKVGDYVFIQGSDSTPSINGNYLIATVPTSTTLTLTGVTITGAGTVGVISVRRAKTIAKAVL